MPRLVAASVKGPRKFVLLAVVVSACLALFFAQRAQAAAYVNPFWANVSASQESAISMVSERAMSPEGVDLRTGELFWNHYLLRTPGVIDDLVFSFTWRSMIAGSSQLGNGIIPNWEVTANYVLLLPGTPNAANGHAVDIRRGTGRIDRFMWNGALYVAPGDVFDTLTIPGATYVLTDKWGNVENFNANGTLGTSVDRNGNTVTWTQTGYQEPVRVRPPEHPPGAAGGTGS